MPRRTRERPVRVPECRIEQAELQGGVRDELMDARVIRAHGRQGLCVSQCGRCLTGGAFEDRLEQPQQVGFRERDVRLGELRNGSVSWPVRIGGTGTALGTAHRPRGCHVVVPPASGPGHGPPPPVCRALGVPRTGQRVPGGRRERARGSPRMRRRPPGTASSRPVRRHARAVRRCPPVRAGGRRRRGRSRRPCAPGGRARPRTRQRPDGRRDRPWSATTVRAKMTRHIAADVMPRAAAATTRTMTETAPSTRPATPGGPPVAVATSPDSTLLPSNGPSGTRFRRLRPMVTRSASSTNRRVSGSVGSSVATATTPRPTASPVSGPAAEMTTICRVPGFIPVVCPPLPWSVIRGRLPNATNAAAWPASWTSTPAVAMTTHASISHGRQVRREPDRPRRRTGTRPAARRARRAPGTAALVRLSDSGSAWWIGRHHLSVGTTTVG